MNLRDLFGVRPKLKQNIFKKSNPMSSTAVNTMDQNVAKYWYPNEKMVVFLVCVNGRCYSSGCMGVVSY